MKKNNTAKKAALDAKNISEALKESTQNALQSMLNEAISKTLMEATDEKCCEEDDAEDVDTEDSYDVEDVDTENPTDDEGCEGGECEDTDDAEDDDEWSDMEDYKVGDNDYDFTGVDGDEVLKVYNKLGDDDQIFVKKDEDGNYELKDEETGAEYVIELGDNADSADEFEDGDDDAELGIELDNEEPEDEGEEEFDIDLGDEEDSAEFEGEDGDDDVEFDIELDDEEPEDEGEEEFDIDLGDEDDDDLLNEEDLGYDTSHNYQKDVMPGLNMSEPADSSTTNDWDAGVPKGNSRPFSGYKNKESNLFTKNVNETATLRARTQTKRAGGSNTTPREHNKEENSGEVRHDVSPSVNEDMKRMINAAKKIQAENKQYKEAINNIKKSLYEAAVLNVTLGQVVKLLSENTTTKAEKASIVERFNKVKTIAESKSLYDTVSRELNESKGNAFSLDRNYSVTNKEALNETTLYQNNNPVLGMMDRMNNLEKMWKNK